MLAKTDLLALWSRIKAVAAAKEADTSPVQQISATAENFAHVSQRLSQMAAFCQACATNAVHVRRNRGANFRQTDQSDSRGLGGWYSKRPTGGSRPLHQRGGRRDRYPSVGNQSRRLSLVIREHGQVGPPVPVPGDGPTAPLGTRGGMVNRGGAENASSCRRRPCNLSVASCC